MATSNILTAALLTLAIGSSGHRVIGSSVDGFTASPAFTFAIGSDIEFSITKLPEPVLVSNLRSRRNSITQSLQITQSVQLTRLPDDPMTRLFQLTNLPTYRLANSPQKPSGDPLAQVEALLQQQKFDAAEPQLQSLTKTHAANPQVWFDLGFAESHLGKNAEAIVAYKKAVELSPKWFEANLNLGLTLAKAGSLPEAATALRAATTLKPSTGGQQAQGNAWFSLAQVLEQSAPKESLAAYQKAAELNPSNAEALWDAGKLLEKQGDAAGAERNYLSAAQMGNSGSLESLISFYLKQKRFLMPKAGCKNIWLPIPRTWSPRYNSGAFWPLREKTRMQSPPSKA